MEREIEREREIKEERLKMEAKLLPFPSRGYPIFLIF